MSIVRFRRKINSAITSYKFQATGRLMQYLWGQKRFNFLHSCQKLNLWMNLIAGITSFVSVSFTGLSYSPYFWIMRRKNEWKRFSPVKVESTRKLPLTHYNISIQKAVEFLYCRNWYHLCGGTMTKFCQDSVLLECFSCMSFHKSYICNSCNRT